MSDKTVELKLCYKRCADFKVPLCKFRGALYSRRKCVCAEVNALVSKIPEVSYSRRKCVCTDVKASDYIIPLVLYFKVKMRLY